MIEVRETTASVVLLGRLNPLIFQPEWLRQNQLIGENEAQEATEGGVEVLHKDISIINLSSMKLLVDQERMIVTALEEPLVRARDFAMSVMQLLGHTPARALGLNFVLAFRASDAAHWHSFGDALGPKDPWSSLLDGTDSDRKGGLRSITMERSIRWDERPGYVRVTFEAPQSAYLDGKISVNSHIELTDGSGHSNGAAAASAVEACWDDAMIRARQISDQLMRRADAV